MRNVGKISSALVLAFFGINFIVSQPVAAAVQPHVAKEIIRSAQKVELSPGEKVEFTIGFKNTGSATWRTDGKNYISIYTYDPKTRKYAKSAFRDESWIADNQTARLKDPIVKPGAIGRVSFTLFAPLEPGEYRETFNLAAENLRWVLGGQFAIDILVKEKAVSIGGIKAAAGYRATKLLVSEQKLSLDTGTSSSFRVAFKNTGRLTWTNAGSAPLSLRLLADSPDLFRHSSWVGPIAAKLTSSEVKPGQVAFFDLTVTAPGQAGSYTPKFSLMAGDEVVDGGQIDIPMDVRQGVVDAIHQTEFARSGNRGPNIRVGICYMPSVWDEAGRKDLPSCTNGELVPMTLPISYTATGSYELLSGSNDTPIKQLSGLTTLTFDFSQRVYTVRNGDFVFTSPDYVRLRPVDAVSTIFELINMDERPGWDRSINYNRYRGTFELRYVPARDRLWLIEELPLEDYIRGLAETSDSSPTEYQKALITAARTYALYIISIEGKHQSQFHHIDRTGNDQVYRGYASELVRPNVAKAAEATRGQVVTYNGEVVVTPYFSRSDGRTRSWSEVWYGNRAWLIGKPAPYDAGRTLFGHGVGMSAADAVGRARDGGLWQDILRYYYTGVDIKQLY